MPVTNQLWFVFRRARYRLRQYCARRPALFFPLYAVNPLNRSRMIGRQTRIVIEGFPRSANTFAVAALLEANPGLGERAIAHHLHAQAQVLRAVARDVPALVLIRRPADAVRSLVVRHPFIRVEEALRDYARFYRDLLPHRARFVIADFDEVTGGFAAVVRRLNEKFGLALQAPGADAASMQRVWAAIDRWNDERSKGALTHLHRPSPERDALIRRVTVPTASAACREAMEVYEKFLGGRPPPRPPRTGTDAGGE
jgi:hypothetical protein